MRMLPKNEIILIFPLSTLSKRTRLTKIARIATDLGLQISTWSWERVPGEGNQELNIQFNERCALMTGGGYALGKKKILYMKWMWVVFARLLRFRPTGPIYCLGFETAFPAWLASKIIRLQYIFDDADRFSLLIRFPFIFNKLVQFFERKTSEGSIVNIIPGYERYEFRNSKQRILKNHPDAKTLSLSKTISVERPVADLVIYVNGWMGETRGMPIINKLAQRLNGIDNICFIAAGRVDGESAKSFINQPNVSYKGEISNAEALSLYQIVDLVFTYYDPVVEINRFAESNKWGDCLAFAVPPIVNMEVVTAEYLRNKSACLSIAYHDVDGLELEIKNFALHPQSLDILKKNINSLTSHIEYFDNGVKNIFQEVYNDSSK